MATIKEEEIVTFEETDSKFVKSLITPEEPKPNKQQDKKKKSKQDAASDNPEIPEDAEEEDHNIPFIHRHRFYESELPEVGDIIMTRIDHLTEYSAVVHLLEYNQMPASLPFSELSARRLRETPQKILRVGKPEVLQVLRVDTAKGYIDMTRKNISPEEKQECFDRYSSAKLLHSILAIAVDTIGTVKIETVYRDLVFPLYAKYDLPLDFFKELVFDASLLEDFPIDEELKKEIVKICKRKLMPKELKIESEIEATCFTHEGIDAIIPAFKAGKEVATQVQIAIVSAPLYSLSLVTKEIDEGIELVQSVIKKVKEELERRGGSLVVKVQPKALAAH